MSPFIMEKFNHFLFQFFIYFFIFICNSGEGLITYYLPIIHLSNIDAIKDKYLDDEKGNYCLYFFFRLLIETIVVRMLY